MKKLLLIVFMCFGMGAYGQKIIPLLLNDSLKVFKIGKCLYRVVIHDENIKLFYFNEKYEWKRIEIPENVEIDNFETSYNYLIIGTIYDKDNEIAEEYKIPLDSNGFQNISPYLDDEDQLR